MMIRCALRDDLDAVEEIERLSQGVPWARSMFESELDQSHGRFWVLEVNGRIQGFAVYRVIGDESELLSIAILPDSRQRGLGSKLLEWTLAELKQEGLGYVRLEVRTGNQAARKLYDNYGFMEDGVRLNYYQNPREDAVLMSCRL